MRCPIRAVFAVCAVMVGALGVACGQVQGPFIQDIKPLTVQPGSSVRIAVRVQPLDGERLKKVSFSTREGLLPAQTIVGKSFSVVIPKDFHSETGFVTGVITAEDGRGGLSSREFQINIFSENP